MIKEKLELDIEISKLLILKDEYKASIYDFQDKTTKSLPNKIKNLTRAIENSIADLQIVKSNMPNETDVEKFIIKLDGIEYKSKEEAGTKLLELINNTKENTKIGEYMGLEIKYLHNYGSFEKTLELVGNGNYKTVLGDSPIGCISRINNTINNINDDLPKITLGLEKANKELEECKIELEKPFEYEERLQGLLKRQFEVNEELGLNNSCVEIVEEIEVKEVSVNISHEI